MIKDWPLKTASVLIRNLPHYRHSCFVAGFKKHGFAVIDKPSTQPKEGDILVAWNRYSMHEHYIRSYNNAGATVLISENGYIGSTKALSKDHHNGADEWKVGEEDRWSKLGVELAPWRKDGDFILILPQRGMGEPKVAMPRDWKERIVSRVGEHTNRPIRIREHPGQNPCKPIEEELKGAWAAVTWGSGAGIKAIIAGVPVFHDFEKWIGADAASLGLDIENPFLGDRMPMLHKMSYAQWSLPEIENGEALAWYL